MAESSLYTATEVKLLVNCLLVLSLNDIAPLLCKTTLAISRDAIALIYQKFVGLMKAHYGYIPRKESITDDILLAEGPNKFCVIFFFKYVDFYYSNL